MTAWRPFRTRGVPSRDIQRLAIQCGAGALESEGLEVVLSPLQLAAILENDSIDQGSCLSNRFWGAASVVGGAMELIGAAALFLAPEPTTVTSTTYAFFFCCLPRALRVSMTARASRRIMS